MRYTEWMRIALCASGLGLVAVTGHAQFPQADSVAADGAHRLEAVRLAEAIRIDGTLDEPIWTQSSPLAAHFVQRQPNPGAPATKETEVRVLYAEDAIYVGARLHDHPDSVIAQLARRDPSGLYSDWFSVMLDSDDDNRTAFTFAVNPREVKRDFILNEDGREESGWDAVWEAKTRLDSLGWTVEMRIPVSQLRFSPGKGTWGVNFGREIARRDEVALWAPIPPDASGFVSRFGALVGLAGLRASTRLEVQPYTVTRVTREPGVSTDPFHRTNALSGSAGADLRYGLTPDLTLSTTLNPDFGQVEADPSQVNLTAYETFFPERRPFFVEGADIFRLGLGNGQELFYSRRIGRAPRGPVPAGAAFREIPEASTILGAAKLSGKTATGWSIGVMDAVTRREEARFVDADGTIRSTPVEPLTNYGIARVVRDFRGGLSALGGIVTTTHRQIEDESLRFLPSASYAGGIDGRHRFGAGNYEVSGWVLGSRVQGDTTALRLVQLAPGRYFQRPDAEHVEFDPLRTSLAGIDANIGIRKIGGGHWRGGVGGRARTPGFEVNDLGFQRGTDRLEQWVSVGYEQYEPSPLFRSWSVYTSQYSGWTWGGENNMNGLNVSMGFQLQNFWRGDASVERSFSTVSVDALRGGPALRIPGAVYAGFGIGTDPREELTANLNASLWREDETGSGSFSASTEMSYRPSARMQLSLRPGATLSSLSAQYVSRATFREEPHFIFGSLDRQTVSLTARLNYAVTPDLSFQFYGQPYLSAGEFSEFKEVADPRAERFGDRFHTFAGEQIGHEPAQRRFAVDVDGDRDPDFFFSDPSFNFKQFRSNAVLRWEYRPGSTLFLVWSQGRTQFVSDGVFNLWDDATRLFGAPGTNVLLLKVNYWLNL